MIWFRQIWVQILMPGALEQTNECPQSPVLYVSWWMLLLARGLLLGLVCLVHISELDSLWQYHGIFPEGNEWASHRPLKSPPCTVHLPTIWHQLGPSRSLHTRCLITRIACLDVGQQQSTLAFRVCGEPAQHLSTRYQSPDAPAVPSLIWALDITNLLFPVHWPHFLSTL